MVRGIPPQGTRTWFSKAHPSTIWCAATQRELTLSGTNCSLLESLYILDCYRVVLLHRPSTLPWHPLERLAKSTQETSPFSLLRNLVGALASPGFEVEVSEVQEFSLATLSGLTPFLRQAMPLAPADHGFVMTPWRTDFVEQAADKWLRMHRDKVEPASQTLYHLMHITMHTNLLAVHNYAHFPVSGPVQDRVKESCRNFISRWVRGQHYEIAGWHAERLLECVEKALETDSTEDVPVGRHRQSQEFLAPTRHSRSTVDIVHVPYSVYYATLVLWCGAKIVDGSCSLTRQSCVHRGTDILAQLKLRIATVLERVLRGLKR